MLRSWLKVSSVVHFKAITCTALIYTNKYMEFGKGPATQSFFNRIVSTDHYSEMLGGGGGGVQMGNIRQMK